MNNIANQVAFLRTSREFPEEIHQLSVEVNRSYLDIANAVNSRTIGLFSVNRAALTGESWFVSNNQKQQTIRSVYTFTSTSSITHGLTTSQYPYFTKMSGTFTDGTNWMGLISGSTVAIAGQISFYVSPTQIVFLVGAGAPALTKGVIVLEYLSQP